MHYYHLKDRHNSAAKEHTILPEAKISAVVLGSLILIMTAAKRCNQTHYRHQYSIPPTIRTSTNNTSAN